MYRLFGLFRDTLHSAQKPRGALVSYFSSANAPLPLWCQPIVSPPPPSRLFVAYLNHPLSTDGIVVSIVCISLYTASIQIGYGQSYFFFPVRAIHPFGCKRRVVLSTMPTSNRWLRHIGELSTLDDTLDDKQRYTLYSINLVEILKKRVSNKHTEKQMDAAWLTRCYVRPVPAALFAFRSFLEKASSRRWVRTRWLLLRLPRILYQLPSDRDTAAAAVAV
jgi:hypothetical protein